MAPPSAGARASALAPFRVRSFRFQWTAVLATSWAFEMEALILGWYILTATGSVEQLATIAHLGYAASTLIYARLGLAATIVIGWRWRQALWRRAAAANSHH